MKLLEIKCMWKSIPSFVCDDFSELRNKTFANLRHFGDKFNYILSMVHSMRSYSSEL